MGQFMKDLAGMGEMTDQVIATDFLLAAKTGIKNYALALTETVTPEVHDVLKRHLDSAINTHVAITGYMLKNGMYHAYEPSTQFRMDIEAADRLIDTI